MDIRDKWALVTGASRGVGARVAQALADKGCRLIVQARTLEATDQLASQLRDRSVTVEQVAAQLEDEQQVAAMIAQVRNICGGPDILYNNAAVMTPFLEAFKVPASDYILSFKVNSIAPIMLCDAFIPQMLARGWGRVVNVTSGIRNQPELMAYSCSKAALDRYVRDMVGTLEGSDVLINLMDPGWLRTDMGGPDAPNDPDSVLPGALVPVLLDAGAGSGVLYQAQEYRSDRL